MKNEFSKRLVNELHRHDMTQRSLALRLNISEVTVSRYCSGERLPTSDILMKIASELNVSAEYLWGVDNQSITFEQVYAYLADKANELTHQQKCGIIALFIK